VHSRSSVSVGPDSEDIASSVGDGVASLREEALRPPSVCDAPSLDGGLRTPRVGSAYRAASLSSSSRSRRGLRQSCEQGKIPLRSCSEVDEEDVGQYRYDHISELRERGLLELRQRESVGNRLRRVESRRSGVSSVQSSTSTFNRQTWSIMSFGVHCMGKGVCYKLGLSGKGKRHL
jgi:hypothetical protein